MVAVRMRRGKTSAARPVVSFSMLYRGGLALLCKSSGHLYICLLFLAPPPFQLIVSVFILIYPRPVVSLSYFVFFIKKNVYIIFFYKTIDIYYYFLV